MSLGEQIAVLDGLSALDPSDGRIGQMRARVDQYAKQIRPNVLSKMNVIDASGGANYSGGSAYAPELPLMPSTVGLAGLRGLRGFGALPGVLPPRMNVIDPSGGANYSGGGDWTPGIPLVSSNSGLATAMIDGGYGRAGLGSAMIDGGYGRAGLGSTLSAADEDLAGAAEAAEAVRGMDASDGRTGQVRARVDQYGRPLMPGVLQRQNVLDFSEGANYSGGSSYPTESAVPLMPSTVGLAGLSASMFDAVPDSKLNLRSSKKIMGKDVVARIKVQLTKINNAMASAPPVQRNRLVSMRNALMQKLATIRAARMLAAKSVAGKKAAAKGAAWYDGGQPGAGNMPLNGLADYAQRGPIWAR